MTAEQEFTRMFVDLGTLFIWCSGLSLIFKAKRMAARFFVCAMLSIACGVVGPEVAHTVPLYVWVILAVLVSLALVRLVLMVFVGRRTADIATGSFLGILMSGAAYLGLRSLKGVRYLFSPRVFDYLRSPWQAPRAGSGERR